MKLLSSTTMGMVTLASLAATAPVLDGEPLQTDPLNATSLENRAVTDPWHFCSDTNWKNFGERAFLAGLRLMGQTGDHMMGLSQSARDEIPEKYIGTPGMCTNLWCGGDQTKGRAVVMYLCLKPETEGFDVLPKSLAQKFHDGFHDCNGKREPQDHADSTSLAFHVWDNGWDLHVEGGYDGMRCPEDMNKDAWPRPDSLNYYPYTTTPKPA